MANLTKLLLQTQDQLDAHVLVKQCPNLRILMIVSWEKFTEENLTTLLEGLTHLREFLVTYYYWHCEDNWNDIFAKYGQYLRKIGLFLTQRTKSKVFYADLKNLCFDLFAKIPGLQRIEDYPLGEIAPILRKDYNEGLEKINEKKSCKKVKNKKANLNVKS